MANRNKWWISPETLVGIANAIRSKKGTTDLIPVTELEAEIMSIVGGGSSWCGEYQEGTNYPTGAIVSFEGNIYLCIKDTDGQQEPTNAEYWQMLNEPNEWRGVYEDGVVYKINEYVYYDGNVYICIEDTDGTQNPTNTEYWQRMNELPNTYGIEVTPTKDIQNIVPEGEYDGFDEVIVNPIPDEYIDTSDATATADKILKDETAYVNGEKITGSILSYLGANSVPVGGDSIVGTWLLNHDLTGTPVETSLVGSIGNLSFTQVTAGASGSSKYFSFSNKFQLYVPAYYVEVKRYGGILAAYSSTGSWKTISYDSVAEGGANYQYRILKITDDTNTSEAFKIWLKANATQEGYVEPLSLSATSPNGILLDTEGKYVDKPIKVVPTLEEKTVTPTAEAQVVATSDGYVGMSAVVVEPYAPIPIEVSTEAEMTALLESGEVGGVYKYTGTTGTYENGALYVLEEEESEQWLNLQS